MFKNICYVTLKGGLGNQLLQYNFANDLIQSGKNVKIDTRFYQNKSYNSLDTPRAQLFNSSFFGFDSTTSFENIYKDNLEKLLYSKKINTYIPFFKNSAFGRFNDSSKFDIDKLPSVSVFDGYWQEVKNIESSWEYLINCLKQNEIFEKAYSSKKINGSTMIHIRRTDYVLLNQELKKDYYKNSIDYLKEKVKDFNYTIFTDDYEWVAKQSFSEHAKNIYSPSSFDNDFLSFCKMLEFENFVIANSTFSYIAASLGSNLNSKVLYPKTWFPNRVKKINFESSWIPIEN